MQFIVEQFTANNQTIIPCKPDVQAIIAAGFAA
jgi:hypothetical protein